MSTSRALLIAFFATVTLVSCHLPEDYMVSEELVQEPDDTLAMNGGTTVNKDESNAHAGITDMHAKTALCAEGQVPCGNGICAENCALLETNGINGEQPHPGFSMEFSPDIHHVKGPPKVAGKVSDYQQLEDNHRRAYQVDQTKAIQKAEAAAGLGFGSHQLALDEKASRFQGKEEDVNIKMNEAAKYAANYRDKTQLHNKAVAAVKVARTQEHEQQQRVNAAKATLKAEKKALHLAKRAVTKASRIEEHARYVAEEAGNTYTKAKAKAIEADNKLQEEKHETEMKAEYEKVAMEAVRKKAEEDEARVAAEQAKVAKKVSKKKVSLQKLKGKHTPEDCKVLPKIYADAGGKCSDCPKWTAKGECDAPQYSKFMHHYCAGSCAASKAAKKTVKTAKKAIKKKTTAKKAKKVLDLEQMPKA